MISSPNFVNSPAVHLLGPAIRTPPVHGFGRLLFAGARRSRFLRPGGVSVSSTCSIQWRQALRPSFAAGRRFKDMPVAKGTREALPCSCGVELVKESRNDEDVANLFACGQCLYRPSASLAGGAFTLTAPM
jgi:hypothetical protein